MNIAKKTDRLNYQDVYLLHPQRNEAARHSLPLLQVHARRTFPPFFHPLPNTDTQFQVDYTLLAEKMGWKNAAVAKSAWSVAKRKFLSGASGDGAKKDGAAAAAAKGKGKKRAADVDDGDDDEVLGLGKGKVNGKGKKAKLEDEGKAEGEEVKVEGVKPEEDDF